MTTNTFPVIWSVLTRRHLAQTTTLPIETIRTLAILMVVIYHVIGSAPEAGLALDYPHPARIVADALNDVHMPLFAFVSGLVFALKPPAPCDLAVFTTSKLRRLILPGALAVALSAAATTLVDTPNAPDGPLWHLAVYPYIHYWFLMSIFVIFMLYAPLDAISGGAALVPAFAASVLLSLGGWAPVHNVFSIVSAIYLLPYFLLGAIVHRHVRGRPHLVGAALLGALLAVAAMAQVRLVDYQATGLIPSGQRDLPSLLLGSGVCVLAIVLLPRSRLLDRFGPYSFTIYLYHVFGLATARTALAALGIDGIGLNIVVGVAGGFFLPVLLHLGAERSAVTRVAVLGLRPARKSGAAIPEARA